jgi:hypothetical protein
VPIIAGAGNPVAGSSGTAGIGKGLNYIGVEPNSYCFAYSGQFTVNNTTETGLLFTIGAHFIRAKFQQSVDYTSVGNGKLTGFAIKVNDQEIIDNLEATQTAGTNENNNPSSFDFIIPPFAKIECTATTDSGADIPFYQVITGRVYY